MGADNASKRAEVEYHTRQLKTHQAKDLGPLSVDLNQEAKELLAKSNSLGKNVSFLVHRDSFSLQASPYDNMNNRRTMNYE